MADELWALTRAARFDVGLLEKAITKATGKLATDDVDREMPRILHELRSYAQYDHENPERGRELWERRREEIERAGDGAVPSVVREQGQTPRGYATLEFYVLSANGSTRYVNAFMLALRAHPDLEGIRIEEVFSCALADFFRVHFDWRPASEAANDQFLAQRAFDVATRFP